MKHIIKYEREYISAGDYRNFVFNEVERNNKFSINISRTFITLHPETNLCQLAAKAVELFYYGDLPQIVFKQKDNTVTIEISSNWYPGKPDEPLTIEKFDEFQIEVPKKSIGFKLD